MLKRFVAEFPFPFSTPIYFEYKERVLVRRDSYFVAREKPLSRHGCHESPVTRHQSRVITHVFVHLHCHSHYSFLRGVAPPEEMIAAAAAQKMPAVALTDTNGLHAAVPFYQAAKAAGVKPIVGVVIDVEFCESKFDKRHSQSAAMVLLAADMEGYSNLCQLVTLRHLGTTELAKGKGAGEDDGRPVTLEELAKHSSGVIALCPLPAHIHDTDHRRGTIYRAPTKTGPHIANRQGHKLSGTNHKSPITSHESLVTSHQSRVTSHFARLKDIFADRLWIEVQHLSPGDGRMLREAERIGRELGVSLAATNNVYFLRPEEHLHHRAVNAIRTGGLLTTVASPEITTGEAWFKPAAEMQS